VNFCQLYPVYTPIANPTKFATATATTNANTTATATATATQTATATPSAPCDNLNLQAMSHDLEEVCTHK